MKKVIRDVADRLLHANIYLDDLKEIEGIVRAAFAALPEPVPFAIKYEIPSEHSFKSLEDLKAHGLRSSNLQMILVPSNPLQIRKTVVAMRRMDNPSFGAPIQLPTDAQWAVFSQIEAVFAARR